jgi:hypothetical protein
MCIDVGLPSRLVTHWVFSTVGCTVVVGNVTVYEPGGGLPDVPEVPDAPDVPDAPEVPDVPDVPDAPLEAPDAPLEAPDVPPELPGPAFVELVDPPQATMITARERPEASATFRMAGF